MKNGKNLKILIATDNRRTRNILLKYCSQIFAYDGFGRTEKISDPLGRETKFEYYDDDELKLSEKYNRLKKIKDYSGREI